MNNFDFIYNTYILKKKFINFLFKKNIFINFIKYKKKFNQKNYVYLNLFIYCFHNIHFNILILDVL